MNSKQRYYGVCVSLCVCVRVCVPLCTLALLKLPMYFTCIYSLSHTSILKDMFFLLITPRALYDALLPQTTAIQTGTGQ